MNTSRARQFALREAIDKFATGLAPHSRSAGEPQLSRRETILHLLRALEPFGERIFTLFHEGFQDHGSAGSKFRKSAAEPPTYVYGLINAQISYDLDVILRGYTQRRAVQTSSSTQAKQQVARELDYADALAYQILKPAIKGGVVQEDATVFTYFEKSLHIRIIPYARVAMIGIPFSALDHPFDWLAVPHEIGHYVYRYSNLENAKEGDNIFRVINLCNKAENDWYGPWFEEIFADVFGCVVAGPLIALSFQELAAQVRADRFNKDDGHHPAPILRPYIYIDTLHQLGKIWGVDLEGVTGALETEWGDYLRTVRPTMTAVQVPKDKWWSVASTREKIAENVIPSILDSLEAFVEKLSPNGEENNSVYRRLWPLAVKWNSIDIRQNIQLDPIHKLMPQSGLTLPPDPKEISPGMTGTRFDELLEDLEGWSQANPVSPKKWSKALTFGGWIEKGPGGKISHG